MMGGKGSGRKNNPDIQPTVDKLKAAFTAENPNSASHMREQTRIAKIRGGRVLRKLNQSKARHAKRGKKS